MSTGGIMNNAQLPVTDKKKKNANNLSFFQMILPDSKLVAVTKDTYLCYINFRIWHQN